MEIVNEFKTCLEAKTQNVQECLKNFRHVVESKSDDQLYFVLIDEYKLALLDPLLENLNYHTILESGWYGTAIRELLTERSDQKQFAQMDDEITYFLARNIHGQYPEWQSYLTKLDDAWYCTKTLRRLTKHPGLDT